MFILCTGTILHRSLPRGCDPLLVLSGAGGQLLGGGGGPPWPGVRQPAGGTAHRLRPGDHHMHSGSGAACHHW